MSDAAETWSYMSNLRERAVTRLTDGVQTNLARTDASDAMAVLFKLASCQSTVDDARSMLHELQVHQVEVEMQQEELLQSRIELEQDLIRQTSLFAHAPAGFLVVDEATGICEINNAGVRLLCVARDAVLRQPFSAFLSASSSEQLQKLLSRAQNGAVPETFEVQLLPKGGVTRKLLCTADRELSSRRFLLVLVAPPSLPS